MWIEYGYGGNSYLSSDLRCPQSAGLIGGWGTDDVNLIPSFTAFIYLLFISASLHLLRAAASKLPSSEAFNKYRQSDPAVDGVAMLCHGGIKEHSNHLSSIAPSTHHSRAATIIINK